MSKLVLGIDYYLWDDFAYDLTYAVDPIYSNRMVDSLMDGIGILTLCKQCVQSELFEWDT